jgi:hypothetical protein
VLSFCENHCHDAHTYYHKVFFQRYFAQKHGKEQVRAAKVDKRKAKDHDSDAKSDGAIEPEGGSSDEDSDPEEAVIWKVGPTGNVRPVWLMESMQSMKASMPKATGDDDDGDEDVDIDDADDDDDSLVEHSDHDFIHDSEPDEQASSDIEGDQEELCAEDDGTVDWEFDGAGLSLSTDASDVEDSVNLDVSVPGRDLTYRL